jgi:tetratricopeptide (TPR) repeat protein
LESNLSQAAVFFAQTLQQQPDNVPALVWLAAVDVNVGRWETAEPLLNKALALQPNSAATLYWLGRVALARGDYRAAVARFEQGLTLDKGRSTLQYQLALAYRGLGDVTKAEAFARNSGVREIEPDDPLMREIDELLDSPSAHEHRGNQALEGGQLAAAAAEFKRAIELAPGDPSPRQHLGTVMFLSGDVDGAVAQLTEALRIAPTFARAHYSLALVLDSRAQTDDVLRELTAALSSDPSYVAARLARADVLRKQRRWQESLADYRQAFTLDPGSARAILGAAMVLASLERFADARDHLAEGLVVLPNQPELHHALARMLAAAPDARVRDGHQALLIMRARLAVDPRSVDLAETMAMVSAEDGQWDEATTWQRQAIAGAQRAGFSATVQHLMSTLALYERRAPCRTPWSDDENLSELARVMIE